MEAMFAGVHASSVHPDDEELYSGAA
jgi:hypothetical protein